MTGLLYPDRQEAVLVTTSVKCPRCSGLARFAGFVSMPPQSIYQCDACDWAEWTAGLPGQLQPKPQMESQPQQQQQGKLEPDE